MTARTDDADQHRTKAIIANLLDVTRQLILEPVPEGGFAADAMGHVRAIEVMLAEWRRGLLAESEPAKGNAYEIVEERRAKRSYSPAPILASFMDHMNFDAYQTLRYLLGCDAVRLQWSWTNLQRAFAANGVSMKVANHEVADDGDTTGAHIGQVWSSYTRVKGVTDDDRSDD
jgi:hypothetical protein